MRAERRPGIVGSLAVVAFAIAAASCAHRGDPFEPVHPHGNDSTKVYSVEYGRWLSRKSPYYVMKSIIVPKDRVLTIEPGVTVVFTKPGQNISVSGTLIAPGKADSLIRFRSTTGGVPGPAAGDWGSIILNAGAVARLAYVDIRYASNAIQGTDVDSLNVEHAIIKYAAVSGIDLVRSNLTLRDSDISICDHYALHLKQCEDPLNKVRVEHCNIGNNGRAGIWSSGSTAVVRRSDIKNNGFASLTAPELRSACAGAHFEGTPGIQLPLFVMCNIEKNYPCDVRNIMPDGLMIGADSTWWGQATTDQMNLLSSASPGQPDQRNCDFDVDAICDAQDLSAGADPTVHFCWWRQAPWPNFPTSTTAGNRILPAPSARWR